MTLTPISIEEWKDIPGYEDQYQASTEGRIRSLPRKVQRTYHRTGTVYYARCRGEILKPVVNAAGYLVVNLGHNDVHTIHELVALTFLGPRPKGTEICHGNGDRTDSRLENLRYDRHSENMRDVLRYGGKLKKLTAKDVRDIRIARKNGASPKKLACTYKVTAAMIWAICARKAFKWID